MSEVFGQSPQPSDPQASPPVEGQQQEEAPVEGAPEHPFYCPGCGKQVDYQQQCTGSPEAPHPPIEVVSSDEIHPNADPANHTAAPDTTNLG